MRGTLIRIIAARDMSRKERHDYYQVKARVEEDPRPLRLRKRNETFGQRQTRPSMSTGQKRVSYASRIFGHRRPPSRYAYRTRCWLSSSFWRMSETSHIKACSRSI